MTSNIKIDVSIIIVNWNTQQLLVDCIKSIKKKTQKIQYEIIVVDNASDDDSVATIERKYPEIKVIQNGKNEGFARANNIGITHSNGRYILLSNTDIKILDNVIDRMAQYMDTHHGIGGVLPRCIDGNKKLRRCCRDLPSLWNIFCEAFYLDKIFPDINIFRGRALPESFYRLTGIAETMPCCFMMIPREVIEKVGNLDERFFFYAEDIDWCRRCLLDGFKMIFFAESTVIHYGGSSTGSDSYRFLVEKNKALLKYWKKHHRGNKYRICVLIYSLHHTIRSLAYFIRGFTYPLKRKHYFNTAKNHSMVCFQIISHHMLNT